MSFCCHITFCNSTRYLNVQFSVQEKVNAVHSHYAFSFFLKPKFHLFFQFCVFQHFSSKEISVLCCPDSERKDAFSLLDKKLQKQHKDLNKSLQFIDVQRCRFNLVVASLHSIVHNLPKQPLGKNVSHLFKYYILFGEIGA